MFFVCSNSEVLDGYLILGLFNVVCLGGGVNWKYVYEIMYIYDDNFIYLLRD